MVYANSIIFFDNIINVARVYDCILIKENHVGASGIFCSIDSYVLGFCNSLILAKWNIYERVRVGYTQILIWSIVDQYQD